MRTFLADHTDAENILTAAREHRQRLGTLTGLAAGEDMTRTTRDVLADVRAVMDAETGMQWPTIAARLAERIPAHYADVTADAISAQCRALGGGERGRPAGRQGPQGCQGRRRRQGDSPPEVERSVTVVWGG